MESFQIRGSKKEERMIFYIKKVTNFLDQSRL